MISTIILLIVGIIIVSAPSIIWRTRYGNKYIEADLLPKRQKFRTWSTWGLIIMVISIMNLGEIFGLIDNIVWQLIPVFLFCNSKVIFEPYYTSEIVDKIDKLCLYLRPFAMSYKENGYSAKGYMGISEPVEKLMCGELNKRIAKTYCIGDPNEALPTTLSASGIYATDAEWKDSVSKLSDKSELILIRIMETDGCLWELQNCINRHLQKTIFIVGTQRHVELLNEFIAIRGLKPPKIDIQDKGGLAIYINNITMKWEIHNIKSKSNIKQFVKTYINSNIEQQDKNGISKLIDSFTQPFNKMDIPSKGTHTLLMVLQPFCYAVYNRWPLAWIIIFTVYFIVSWIASLIVSLEVDNQLLFLILFIALNVPWLWLGPRITHARDTWGSRYLTQQGNKALLKWVIAYMFFIFVSGILMEIG